MEAAVGLGSNQGDRAAHLRAGFGFLATLAEAGRVAASPWYETAPVDCPPGAAPFFNAVAVFDTAIGPEALLDRLRDFEAGRGRPAQRERNAPRPIDLDLLYLGALSRAEPDLTLPHPRLAERRFVLQPLCDLRPDLVLPGRSRTVRQLLEALPEGGILRRVTDHH